MIRRPVVANKFYEGNFAALNNQVEDCFLNKLGPGALPQKSRTKHVRAIISPHAGFSFSGPCAAWTYKEIGESEFPDLFIILGVNHHDNSSCISNQDWETPLGVVKHDQEFVNALIDSKIFLSNQSHHFEHSVEVQLPFLQFVSRDRSNDLRIVPILIADYDFKTIAEKISAALEKTSKKAIFIVSGDFTHFGHNYDYVPFSTNIKTNLKNLDLSFLDSIKKLDPVLFLKEVEKKRATVCGKLPIAVLLEILRNQKPRPTASLLQYYCSGDIVGDYTNVVGYAAVKFE